MSQLESTENILQDAMQKKEVIATDLQLPDPESHGIIIYVNSKKEERIRKISITQTRPFGFSFFFTDNGSRNDPFSAEVYYHPNDPFPIRWGILHGAGHMDPWIIKEVYWQKDYKSRFSVDHHDQLRLFKT